MSSYALLVVGSLVLGQPGGDWFNDYKPFADIEARLHVMAAERPDLCTLVDIGDSIEGRDIWALQIGGTAADKPGVLFSGTQHAREWISPMTNMFIAEHLVYGYDTDPTIRSRVDSAEIMIVPVVNPDGYVYSWTPNNRMWRKNRRDNGDGTYGVDLNRNWGAGWGGTGSSGTPSSTTYRGPEAFSEPETAALSDFFIANPQIVSAVDFHSYGQVVLSPYGYTYDLPADHDLLMDVGTGMASAMTAVHGETYDAGPTAGTLYQVSGGMKDWVYDDQGALAYTIELRPEGSPWFELPPDEIIPTGEEGLAAALYLIDRSIAVPEPSTLLLLGMGAVGLLWYALRMRIAKR
ncbi:MAG: PEP-CTERM sorting domain-containing protein [Candidatus Nealsonbacteria bacterium]|nr:PEP-CTERM sorting domain-containing protein [Candidatus Nealsonbacteria bacterium]